MEYFNASARDYLKKIRGKRRRENIWRYLLGLAMIFAGLLLPNQMLDVPFKHIALIGVSVVIFTIGVETFLMAIFKSFKGG